MNQRQEEKQAACSRPGTASDDGKDLMQTAGEDTEGVGGLGEMLRKL